MKATAMEEKVGTYIGTRLLELQLRDPGVHEALVNATRTREGTLEISETYAKLLRPIVEKRTNGTWGVQSTCCDSIRTHLNEDRDTIYDTLRTIKKVKPLLFKEISGSISKFSDPNDAIPMELGRRIADYHLAYMGSDGKYRFHILTYNMVRVM